MARELLAEPLDDLEPAGIAVELARLVEVGGALARPSAPVGGRCLHGDVDEVLGEALVGAVHLDVAVAELV
eukprot:2991637-Alexandrium_andersonii.AAC.1